MLALVTFGPKNRDGLSGDGVVIETQHSAKPDLALKGAVRRDSRLFASDEPIAQSLVIPLGVVVRHKVSDRPPQRRLVR